MKTLATSILSLVAATALSLAQTTVSETTTTAAPLQAAGTVTTFDPTGSIVLTGEGGAPVTYAYSKSTTVVDEAGNPVSVDTIKSGLPITVYYSGDQRTISKVVVRKAVAVPAVSTEETTTTTTTTTK